MIRVKTYSPSIANFPGANSQDGGYSEPIRGIDAKHSDLTSPGSSSQTISGLADDQIELTPMYNSHPTYALNRLVWLKVWILFLLASSVMPSVCYPQESAATTGSAEKLGKFSGAKPTEYPGWFKSSFLELEYDVDEASESGKRVMLLFHQDGCPYCNAFVERNLSQKDIEQTLRSKFDVIEINMWGDREVATVEGKIYSEKAFAAALKVQFTPTILFLNEQGQVALRLNGYYDPDRFRLALDFVVGKHEQSRTFTEYLQQYEIPATSGTLTTRPYFQKTTDNLPNRPGKDSKPLIIFFEQKACKNCRILHDKILSKELSLALLEQFDVYQIDMWGNATITTPEGVNTTGREWAKALNVNYAPTLVLYAPDGHEVIRSEAYFKSFHIQSILDYVASDAWRSEESFQRYISARADHLREQGIDVDIWE